VLCAHTDASPPFAQAAKLAKQAADARSESIVLAHRTEPAAFPIAELGGHEAGKPRPASAKTSGGVGARVDGQPALQLVFDVDGGTWTRRVRDVLADSCQALV